MLKISVIETDSQRKFVLEGKLIAPWIAELRTAWKTANRELQGRELMIDIANITHISQEGENALLELMKQGAIFRCRGVLMKHVLRQLERQKKRGSTIAICSLTSKSKDGNESS
jgi:hypothetical protein